MCELGRRGRELLQEMKSYDRFTLSPFNEELVRLVFSEVNEHDLETKKIVSEMRQRQEENGDLETPWDEITATTMCTHYECIKRNKRLLLIYMSERMNRLKAVRWSKRALPKLQADRCCPTELQFYKEYDKVLNDYMSKAGGVGMDLTLDLAPPKDTFIAVRGLQDQGDVVFSFGLGHILKGTLLNLPLDEAEPLIRDGVVEMLDWDNGYK